MHLTLTAKIVAGIISYLLFIFFLCAGLAIGKRKDQRRLDICSRLDRLRLALKNHVDEPRSDCPTLSAILVTAASVGLVKAGMNLVIANSPHSPLVLELTESPTNSDALQLLAYHYRAVENCFVRESEMAFDVYERGCQYALKVIRYSPAKPQYLVPFALLWSEELQKKRYIDIAQSLWRKAKVA